MPIFIGYDTLLAVVVATGVCSLAYLVVRTNRRRLPYPPGPKSLPIVGNLFNMPSQEEWVTYRKWSKDCGMGLSLAVFAAFVHY